MGSLNTTLPATTRSPPTGNFLLGALPEEDFRRFRPHLMPVALPLGKVMSEAGERVRHVYFPSTGIVSLLTLLQDGTAEEFAIVGNEGVVGISSFLEGAARFGPPCRVAVTTAGQAYRLPVDILTKEFERGGELWHRLLRYTQALTTQIAQVAVCNRHHRLEAQLCRWLLLRLDRQVGSELHLTHQQMADLLGVRRVGVTEAANHLQDFGLIRCGRGRIDVLDRSGLEQHACECYGVIEREYARLLGGAKHTSGRAEGGQREQQHSLVKRQTSAR